MNEIEPPFALTQAERNNPFWLKLKAHFESERQKKRGKNDGPLDPLQTATLRGEINSLSALIRLGDEPPVIPD